MHPAWLWRAALRAVLVLPSLLWVSAIARRRPAELRRIWKHRGIFGVCTALQAAFAGVLLGYMLFDDIVAALFLPALAFAWIARVKLDQDLYHPDGMIRVDSQTAVVLGGASGVGLETARGLALLGARVYVCDVAEWLAEAAAMIITAECPSADVRTCTLDPQDASSLEQCVRRIKKAESRVDMIVFSATDAESSNSSSDKDRLMHSYLSFACSLRQLLDAAAPARIVTVLSDSQEIERMEVRIEEDGCTSAGDSPQNWPRNRATTKALADYIEAKSLLAEAGCEFVTVLVPQTSAYDLSSNHAPTAGYIPLINSIDQFIARIGMLTRSDRDQSREVVQACIDYRTDNAGGSFARSSLSRRRQSASAGVVSALQSTPHECTVDTLGNPIAFRGDGDILAVDPVPLLFFRKTKDD